MARRKRTDAEPPIFDAELADMPADLRWREWMNRIEAVLFAAPKPVEREVLGAVPLPEFRLSDLTAPGAIANIVLAEVTTPVVPKNPLILEGEP